MLRAGAKRACPRVAGVLSHLDARVRPLAVLFLLLTTGWAANHFSAVLPALRVEEDLSPTLLAAVFGLYAVGLLPGLLAGGALSDRYGRATIALPGAALATVGTLVLLVWHLPAGLAVGRVVVGLGAGATFSAGTAWMADLGGSRGATLAGIALTSGFGGGPVVSGILAQWFPAPLVLPYLVSGTLSVAAITSCLTSRPGAPELHAQGGASFRTAPPAGTHRSVRSALGWALPIAPLVFTTASIGLVTLPSRLPDRLDGPALTGLTAAIVLGSGLLAQTWARHHHKPAGTIGAASGALGLALSAAAGAQAGLLVLAIAAVLLGICYGLCLHAGLHDIEERSPDGKRGSLTGIFYVGTYLGFGVPVLLEVLREPAGVGLPLGVLAVISAVAFAQRALRSPRALVR